MIDLADDKLTCMDCDGDKIRTRWHKHEFVYGPGQTKLVCMVPVRTCIKCGAQWTDYEASEIETREVFKHERRLGVKRDKFASAEERAAYEYVQALVRCPDCDEFYDPTKEHHVNIDTTGEGFICGGVELL